MNTCPPPWFTKILRDLSSFPYRGRVSPHFYGEPSLDGRLVDFMKLARELVPGGELTIHTNGINLTTDLYRQLIEVGVNGFLVTRHTPKWPKNVLAIQANEADASRYLRMHDLDNTVLFNRGGTVKPRKERRERPPFLDFSSSARRTKRLFDAIVAVFQKAAPPHA